MPSLLVVLDEDVEDEGFLYAGAVLLDAVDLLPVEVLLLTVLLEPMPLRTVVVLLALDAVELSGLLVLTDVPVVLALGP